MLETWRWFGPDDPISLRHIVQTGAQGVVTSLHHIATGDAWPHEDIQKRKQKIETAGLTWSVVESVPLHNDIKTRTRDYARHIENYKTSICNIGKAGIKTICYNFMPVVDWTRTNLSFELSNASQSLRFEMSDFVAYDIFILQRDHAEDDYEPAVVEVAEKRFHTMSDHDQHTLEKNIIAGLPGGEGTYTRSAIKSTIEEFIALGTSTFRQNLIEFLTEIIPVAEKAGVNMCIHPDDPPFSLFGLPRVVSTASDLRKIFDHIPSISNGLTLCAGSFGAREDNNLTEIAQEFGARTHFVHLRNVIREHDGSFYEAEHLKGDNDMVSLIRTLLEEEERRKQAGRHDNIPMRPDHGHLIGDELNESGNINPGYSFAGRLKGLAELRGVIHALNYIAQIKR